VPVKIVFDEPLPADRTLGPGLSVTPEVAVAGLDLPGWLCAAVAVTLGVVAGLIFGAVARRRNPGI
jgi:hypothetical protein